MSQAPGSLSRLLARERIPAAELDSSARFPAPKCLPGTRRPLVGRVISRLLPASGLRHNALWLYGPPGSGKTAIAQTVAEHFRDGTGKLGAAVFLSHLNSHFKKESIFPTIAQQLATYHSAYKQFLRQLLTDDPTIFERDLSTQFRKLIAEPFSVFKSQKRPVVPLPLLIVLDGFDRCDERTAVSILQLICTGPTRDPPLVWMVCSRPESHLAATFSHIKFAERFIKEEVVVSSNDEDDIVLYLQDGFQKIRQRYEGSFTNDSSPWPSPSMLRAIAKSSSGLFRFASIVIKLVGEAEDGAPRRRLSALLDFLQINSLAAPGVRGPYPLDPIYKHILSTISSGDTLEISTQILGFCTYHSAFSLPIQALSNFLHLDEAKFTSALRGLNAVLNYPSPFPDPLAEIFLIDPSFGAFLKDPSRSGRFHITEAQAHYNIVIHCIRWSCWFAQRSCMQNKGGECCRVEQPLAMLKWAPQSTNQANECLDIIGNFVFTRRWKACSKAVEHSGDALGMITGELRRLDICPEDHIAQTLKQIPNVGPVQGEEAATATRRALTLLSRSWALQL